MTSLIPVSSPLINKPIALRYLKQAIQTGWISSKGLFVPKFEQAFAKFVRAKSAVSCTSGTAALHLALAALNIGPGDEVIVPAFTMIAPLFAILYTGATPVLVDVDPTTYTLNPQKIAAKITPKTRAIIAVHIYGHPADMDSIHQLAHKHHLTVIEDAAEGLGATYKNKPVGSLSHLACFSFYANKLLTTGEGGMVVTNNKNLSIRLRSLADMAHSPQQRFLHTNLAFNYRFTNLQAALGLAQLSLLPSIIQKTRLVAHRYTQSLKNLPLTLPQEASWANSSYWMYAIQAVSRTKLQNYLNQQGIDTRNFFIPMHRQPVFQKMGLFKHESYPVSDHISRHGLYLPSGPQLSLKDQQYICRTIHNFYAHL